MEEMEILIFLVILASRFEISDLNFHVNIAHMFWAHFEGLFGGLRGQCSLQTASKSKFTSDLEFVAQIAYATMFVWAI